MSLFLNKFVENDLDGQVMWTGMCYVDKLATASKNVNFSFSIFMLTSQ